ncbi:MAG TPA: SBBP repeat-containing protein [Blastocatellia bacterium]|nr:SBBP repeat-containing protein [Blastocatellia bacterium]
MALRALFVSALLLLPAIFLWPPGVVRSGGPEVKKGGETTAIEDRNSSQQTARQQWRSLQPHFEAAQDQAGDGVRYVSRGRGFTLGLKSSGATLELRRRQRSARERSGRNGLTRDVRMIDFMERSAQGGRREVLNHRLNGKDREFTRETASIEMRLLGANSTPVVRELEPLSSYSSYFIGRDPAAWRSRVPHFARIRYEDVYQGISLAYHGSSGQLEYDFIVQPGADPKAIRLRFEGAGRTSLDRNGNLVLKVSGGEIVQPGPVIYQELNGERRAVAGGYRLEKDTVSFRVGDYDHSLPLVIDPVLGFSTYLGGEDDDLANGIDVDAAGNAYVTGVTYSFGYPQKGALQPFLNGLGVAFVTKLNKSGQIVYSTFIGGEGEDVGFGIVVGADGAAYVTGSTDSLRFPVVNTGIQQQSRGLLDAFILKINPAGTALVYSTYFGGSDDDTGYSIALDNRGNAYITGETYSGDLQTVSAFQFGPAGISNAFVVKINAAGSLIVYSTYLGGRSMNIGFGITVDASGSAHVTGATDSGDFPVRDPAQTTFGGRVDVFVTKLNPNGNQLVWSTLLGGNGDDVGMAVAVDGIGNTYVTGLTDSGNFPGTAPQTPPTGDNAFVARLRASGSLLKSVYLGGSADDVGFDIDATPDFVCVVGRTTSTNFPVRDPLDYGDGRFGDRLRGPLDGFVARLDPQLQTLFSSYLGGSGEEKVFGVACELQPDDIWVAGLTDSNDFPVKNPAQKTIGGRADAFATRIIFPTPPGRVVTASAASYSTASQANEAIVAAFGDGLAGATQAAAGLPLPTSLAGTSIRVRDAAGNSHQAPLFFVSANQVNYLIPSGAAPGPAVVEVARDGAVVSTGWIVVVPIAPGLFTADTTGNGVPAALLLRVKADGAQVFEPVADFDVSQGKFVARALDLRNDQCFLVLFGTGVRNRSSLGSVSVRVGGVESEVSYAGDVPGFTGLDQLNVRLPQSLTGRGAVDVVVVVDGREANIVNLKIR